LSGQKVGSRGAKKGERKRKEVRRGKETPPGLFPQQTFKPPKKFLTQEKTQPPLGVKATHLRKKTPHPANLTPFQKKKKPTTYSETQDVRVLCELEMTKKRTIRIKGEAQKERQHAGKV